MRTHNIVVCAAVSAGLSLASQVHAQNLLADPGFEEQLSAPNPDPDGVAGWANFGGANFFETGLAHGGNWVLDTPDGGGGYSVPGTYQVLAASPGEVFTLSGWVFTPNALVPNSNDYAILQLSFFTGAPPNNYAGGTGLGSDGVDVGTPIGGPASTVSLPQGVWTFASVTATAPATTASLGVYLLDINADANADFYFDDVSLTTTSAPEPTTLSLGVLGCLSGLPFYLKRRKQ